MKLRQLFSGLMGKSLHLNPEPAQKRIATEFYEHKYSNYAVGLPAELEGFEPLNDTYLEKTQKVAKVWWSSVHETVHPPIKSVTIFTALETKHHAKRNPDWERGVTKGAEDFMVEGAGYASCEDVELPGVSGIYFTSRGDGKLRQSHFTLQAGGKGGVLNISLWRSR